MHRLWPEQGGEIICFTDENYNIIQQMELPALKPDMSWARRDDGRLWLLRRGNAG